MIARHSFVPAPQTVTYTADRENGYRASVEYSPGVAPILPVGPVALPPPPPPPPVAILPAVTPTPLPFRAAPVSAVPPSPLARVRPFA